MSRRVRSLSAGTGIIRGGEITTVNSLLVLAGVKLTDAVKPVGIFRLIASGTPSLLASVGSSVSRVSS